MNEIIFGFSKPRKARLFSWILRMCEGTNFSHCYVRFWSESLQRWLVYQASFQGGLQFISYDKFKDVNQVIEEYRCNATDQEKLRLLIRSVDNAGDVWSIPQLLGIGWVRLMKYFKEEVSNPWPMGWVCTEVIWEFISELGIEMTVDRNSVGLKDIRQAILLAVMEYSQGGRWSALNVQETESCT